MFSANNFFPQGTQGAEISMHPGILGWQRGTLKDYNCTRQ